MRIKVSRVPAMLALMLGVLVPVAGAQAPALDLDAIFARAAPGVVIIRTLSGGTPGTGTGFVVDRSGSLVTAAHVARGADRLEVEFRDAGRMNADLVGYDARRDVALLRVQPRGTLAALDLGDSTLVKEGEPVAVIGTPRGRPWVMTSGVVRGTGLTLPGLFPEIFTMFDAVVEPGNSGGPLLNGRGQVIGVVVARSQQSQGPVGLAVSSTTVHAVLPTLVGGARLERAWIGISGTTLEQPVLRATRRAGGGVLILDVIPDSPAARAGLRADHSSPPGDVIISIDGEDVTDWDDLLISLGAREPGQRIRLGILRGGREIEIPLTLDVRPQ